jgi:hypothetical protein
MLLRCHAHRISKHEMDIEDLRSAVEEVVCAED